MKLLFKCQPVQFGIIFTCKTECKGLFCSRKACKHHRTTLRELADVKPLNLPCIYPAHSCEINLRQLVATFNRFLVWKYVTRSWAPHVLFFFILHLHVLTFHFFFATENVQKWQRGDHFFPREQFFDTVSYWLNDDTYTIIPVKKEEFRHPIKCETR